MIFVHLELYSIYWQGDIIATSIYLPILHTGYKMVIIEKIIFLKWCGVVLKIREDCLYLKDVLFVFSGGVLWDWTPFFTVRWIIRDKGRIMSLIMITKKVGKYCEMDTLFYSEKINITVRENLKPNPV